MPQTVSEVRCKQPATAPVPAAPKADQWVACRQATVCTLSETAALWINGLLRTVAKERSYRKVEHACLDDAEKAGLIQQ